MRPRPRPERVRTGPRPKIFFEAEARPPDTLENNSVCMSIKNKILAFRT